MRSTCPGAPENARHFGWIRCWWGTSVPGGPVRSLVSNLPTTTGNADAAGFYQAVLRICRLAPRAALFTDSDLSPLIEAAGLSQTGLIKQISYSMIRHLHLIETE